MEKKIITFKKNDPTNIEYISNIHRQLIALKYERGTMDLQQLKSRVNISYCMFFNYRNKLVDRYLVKSKDQVAI